MRIYDFKDEGKIITIEMKNKVLIIGGDHHNTLGVVESFAEKGIKVPTK